MVLTLNGKKNSIRKDDFIAAFQSAGLDGKQQENIFNKMGNAKSSWLEMIQNSFLTGNFKEQYEGILCERLKTID